MTDGSPTVAVVGDGPPIEAVSAALSDVDATVDRTDIGALGSANLAIVAGVAGSAGFGHANRTAIRESTHWIGVEIGGIGGYPTDAATVTGFSPDGPCFTCLQHRVDALTDATGDDAGQVSRPDARFAGAIAGRLATQYLSGADVAGRVTETPDTTRTLLPVPHCPACATSGRTYTLGLSHRAVSVTDAAERAEQAVDDRIGIVEVIGERESYPVPYYLAQLAPTEGFSDGSIREHAAGVSPDWDVAYMKALGEALERYAAAVYRTDEFETSPAASLSDPISPSGFVRPSDAPEVPPDEPIDWVGSTRLTDDTTVHVPASFVVFPPPDEDLAPAITTGLGLGSSTVEAALSGLYEVIERDATMLAWYSTFDPVALDVDDSAYRALERRAASEDLSIRVVLVTQDVDVPVVAAAVHREAWPRFATGSAAALDATAAARDAVAEALQNWMELRSLGREDAEQAGQGVARYADRPAEVGGFFDADSTVAATAVGPDPPPTGADELDTLLDRVTAAGLTPAVTRLTTKDVAQLGFDAVRVLVPTAQPLFVGEPYFGERARSVPRELGYQPRLDRAYHPFP